MPESTIIPASQVVLNGRGRANESDVETPSEGCQNLHEHLKNLTVETNQPSDSVSSLNNASVLIDGAYPFSSSVEGAYGVGDNAVLAFDFVRPVDLKTINFYSWWSDTGRNGMGIAGLYVRRAGKTEYRRVKMDFASYDGPDCGLVASLTVATDGWMAEGITSVRIVFDKADNNGTACQEIEFFGRKAAKRGFKLIVR